MAPKLRESKRRASKNSENDECSPSKKMTPEKSRSRKNSVGKENVSRKPNRNIEKELEASMKYLTFEDETATLAVSAIENYFMQGKTAMERRNKAKNKVGKRADVEMSDDEKIEEDEEESAQLTTCNLGNLRDFITKENSSKASKIYLKEVEEKEFKKWLLYLASGFNILLHGVGSKRDVLTNFAKSELKDYTWMRIDARLEDMNPKAFFAAINDNMKLNVNGRGMSTVEWARSISKTMSKKGQQLIVLLDNIESADWREEQEAICALVEDKKTIKLIATVDHLYSTLIWNSRQVSTLCFVHVTLNTFTIPIQELITGESRLLGLDAKSNQSTHTIQSLDAFWKSLALNSQKLFRLFFVLYFQSKKPVKFWDLFNDAKDEFIVSTDAALRTQIVEFKDHRILKWTRGDDGNDQLSGIVDQKLISEFLKSKGMPLEAENDEE